MLAVSGYGLDAVIVLTVDADELVGRLLGRAKLAGRADDTEAVTRRRQEVYLTQTEALVNVYRRRGSLIEVNGNGHEHDVTQRIFGALAAPVSTGSSSLS
jgi:adenylate kinase